MRLIFDLGSVFLNEIAPRPHNSGHYTIEACYTSQFEQHLRAVVGLPLGPCEMKTGAAVMINILGHGSGEEGLRATFKPCSVAMATPGASVHWYGKSECRRGRKMGHITVVGESMLDVTEHVQKILAAASPDAIPYPITCSPVVGVIMGSDSDLPTMRPCAQILEEFGVPFELTIVSAHRTPDRMMSYAQSAHERGLRIIIAAAGGAAHLPGMVAAITPLPVIGVPVALKYLDGMDSLYSIVQMPRGVPVATVAINNSTNAALLAIRMLGSHSPHYMQKMIEYQQKMNTAVLDKVEMLNQVGWQKYAA
jgi:phosphoribosylaminoimidazole carboxylase